jgi:hypothetical protein
VSIVADLNAESVRSDIEAEAVGLGGARRREAGRDESNEAESKRCECFHLNNPPMSPKVPQKSAIF